MRPEIAKTLLEMAFMPTSGPAEPAFQMTIADVERGLRQIMVRADPLRVEHAVGTFYGQIFKNVEKEFNPWPGDDSVEAPSQDVYARVRLKMYRVEDAGEVHSVIAASEADAAACIVEAGLCESKTVEEYTKKYDPVYRERSPTELVTRYTDGEPETDTVKGWIEREGRGLFSSSVF